MARRGRGALAAALLLGLLVLAAKPAPSDALRLFGYNLFESGSRSSGSSSVGVASQPSIDVVETHPAGGLSVMAAVEGSADAAGPRVSEAALAGRGAALTRGFDG